MQIYILIVFDNGIIYQNIRHQSILFKFQLSQYFMKSLSNFLTKYHFLHTQQKNLNFNSKHHFQLQANPPFIQHRINSFQIIQNRINTIYQQIEKPNITVKLKDGKEIRGNAFSTTALHIAKNISKSLAEASLVAKVKYIKKYKSPINKIISSPDLEDHSLKEEGCEFVDLSQPLEGDCHLQLITFEDKIGKDVFWHSTSHLLGQSLQNKYGAWLCHGPSTENGFFYDCYMGNNSISQNDYEIIQKQIKAYGKEKQAFERIVLTKSQALEMFQHNPFKLQLINKKIPENGLTSAYRCGNFVDLCTGPHIPSADKVKGFKVTKNSSAYWLGKKQNENLQRIYGISFPKMSMLEKHVKMQQQLIKRDHRTIGPKQDLFHFTNLSPGCALFYPHGTIIYNRLTELMRSEYKIRGYSEVISPNMYQGELWKVSGHYFKYKENIYWIHDDHEQHGFKPMNCPGHCIMFNLVQHSYRDLPIRMAEFGVLHRNEVHGSLSGLTRVRRFQQDDAHIFCTQDQIQSEILGVLDLVHYIYSIFGFRYVLELSTRPQKYLGNVEDWDKAEAQLHEALKKFGKQYKINEGDGAFYGPKIDVKLFDAFGRQHQCGTVQLDFQLPLRFNLQYRAKHFQDEHSEKGVNKEVHIGSDQMSEEEDKYNKVQPLKQGFERPVIIHRAIFGSLERFIAVLCEHTGGKWDFWLSPRQLQIIPMSKAQEGEAEKLYNSLLLKGYCVDMDKSGDKLEKKIRNAQLNGYNFTAVIGAKEVESGTISIRKRDTEKPLGLFKLKELMEMFESLQVPKSRKRLELQKNTMH